MKSSINSDFALFKAVSCEAEIAVPEIVVLFQSMELFSVDESENWASMRTLWRTNELRTCPTPAVSEARCQSHSRISCAVLRSPKRKSLDKLFSSSLTNSSAPVLAINTVGF